MDDRSIAASHPPPRLGARALNITWKLAAAHLHLKSENPEDSTTEAQKTPWFQSNPHNINTIGTTRYETKTFSPRHSKGTRRLVLTLPSKDSENRDELRTVSSPDWESVRMAVGMRMVPKNPPSHAIQFAFCRGEVVPRSKPGQANRRWSSEGIKPNVKPS